MQMKGIALCAMHQQTSLWYGGDKNNLQKGHKQHLVGAPQGR